VVFVHSKKQEVSPDPSYNRYMSRLIDMTGKRFGRLTVVFRSPSVRSSGALWVCVCDCGGQTTADSLKLRSGHTKSCGCLRKESFVHETHGLSRRHARTYRTWKEMRQRCTNKNSTQWQWYGGRGIKVCDRWGDFSKFFADMGARPSGMTIDRFPNPDGDYEPSNCRWATAAQQAETNRGTFKPGMTPWNKGHRAAK
jgi:hypothetical protein